MRFRGCLKVGIGLSMAGDTELSLASRLGEWMQTVD